MNKQEQIKEFITYMEKELQPHGYAYRNNKQVFVKETEYIIHINYGNELVNLSFGVDFGKRNKELSTIYNSIKYIKPLSLENLILLKNYRTWFTISEKINSVILPESKKFHNLDYLINLLSSNDPFIWGISLSERIRLLPILYLLKSDYKNAKFIIKEMKNYLNQDQFIPNYTIFSNSLERYIQEKTE